DAQVEGEKRQLPVDVVFVRFQIHIKHGCCRQRISRPSWEIENTTVAPQLVLHRISPTRSAGDACNQRTGRDATCAAPARSSFDSNWPDLLRNSARYPSEIGAASGSKTVRGFLCTPLTRYS